MFTTPKSMLDALAGMRHVAVEVNGHRFERHHVPADEVEQMRRDGVKFVSCQSARQEMIDSGRNLRRMFAGRCA